MRLYIFFRIFLEHGISLFFVMSSTSFVQLSDIIGLPVSCFSDLGLY